MSIYIRTYFKPFFYAILGQKQLDQSHEAEIRFEVRRGRKTTVSVAFEVTGNPNKAKLAESEVEAPKIKKSL